MNGFTPLSSTIDTIYPRSKSTAPSVSEGLPLVNAHISPHDPIQKGHIDLYASRFDILPSKIKRQQGRIGGGLRGVVSRFSYGARRRMQTSLAGIQGQHYQTMLFLTLTYHDDWQGREPRKDLDAYIKRLRRRHPDLAYVWRLEPQKRLAPHFHLLLFFTYRLTELQKAEMSQQWHELVEPDSPFHELYGAKVEADLDGMEGVRVYISKYCAKVQGEDERPEWWQGRYWASSRNLKVGRIATVALRDDDEEQFVKTIAADYLVSRSLKEIEAADSDRQRRAASRKQRFAKVVRVPHIKALVMLKEAELDFIPYLLHRLKDYRKERCNFPVQAAQYVLPRQLPIPNKTQQRIVKPYSMPSYHNEATRRSVFVGCPSPYTRPTTRGPMVFVESKLPPLKRNPMQG